MGNAASARSKKVHPPEEILTSTARGAGGGFSTQASSERAESNFANQLPPEQGDAAAAATAGATGLTGTEDEAVEFSTSADAAAPPPVPPPSLAADRSGAVAISAREQSVWPASAAKRSVVARAPSSAPTVAAPEAAARGARGGFSTQASSRRAESDVANLLPPEQDDAAAAATAGVPSSTGVEASLDEVVEISNELLGCKRETLPSRVAALHRSIDACAGGIPEDAHKATEALPPLLLAAGAQLRSGRGFNAACRLLHGAHRLLAIVSENQVRGAASLQTESSGVDVTLFICLSLKTTALANGGGSKKAKLLEELKLVRASVRQSPTLRKSSPLSVLELHISSIELCIYAMRDPGSSKKAIGALGKLGKGLVMSILERKIDAGIFEGMNDIVKLSAEEQRARNSERLSYQLLMLEMAVALPPTSERDPPSELRTDVCFRGLVRFQQEFLAREPRWEIAAAFSQGLLRVGLWPGLSPEVRRHIWAGHGELTGLRDLLCFGEAPARIVGSVKGKRPIFDCAAWPVGSRRRQHFEPSEEVTFIQRVVKTDQHGLQIIFFELEGGGWISDRDTPSSGKSLISCQPTPAATVPPFAARMAMLITNLVGTQASPSDVLEQAAAEVGEEVKTGVWQKALDIMTRVSAVATSRIETLRANGTEQWLDTHVDSIKNDLEQLITVIERTSKPVEQLTQLLLLLGSLDMSQLRHNLINRVTIAIENSVSEQFAYVHTAFKAKADFASERLTQTLEYARPALELRVKTCKVKSSEHASFTWCDFQQTIEQSEYSLNLAPLTEALDTFEALSRPPVLRLSSVHADVLKRHVASDGRLDSSLGTAALLMTGALPGLVPSLSSASLDETLVNGCEWLGDVLSGKATGIDAAVDVLSSIWRDVYPELEKASTVTSVLKIEYLQRVIESLDGPVMMLRYASTVAQVANDPSNIVTVLAERTQQVFDQAREFVQGLVSKLSVSVFKECTAAFRKHLDDHLAVLEQQLCTAPPRLQENSMVSQMRGSAAPLVSTLGALKEFGGPLMFRTEVTPEQLRPLRSSVASDGVISRDSLLRLMTGTLDATVPPGSLRVVTVNGLPYNGSLDEFTASVHIEVEGPSITSFVDQTIRTLSVIERNSAPVPGLAHVATTARDAANLLKSLNNGLSSTSSVINSEMITLESDLASNLAKTSVQMLTDGTSLVFQKSRDRVLAYFDEQCDHAEKVLGHVQKSMEDELEQVTQSAKQAVEKAKNALPMTGDTVGPTLDTGLYKAHAMLLDVQNDLRELIAAAGIEANQCQPVNEKVRAALLDS